jgi:hypothetical protein
VAINQDEARHVALDALSTLRGLSYAELRDQLLDKKRWERVVAPSGTVYNVCLYAIWDDRKRRDLRIWADVDDGSPASFTTPVVETFIIAPSGSFVGE